MIVGACLALVLGIALVAPTTRHAAGPVPAPSESILLRESSARGASIGRTLVELPPEAVEPGQAQNPPPTRETELLDATTVRETSQERN